MDVDERIARLTRFKDQIAEFRADRSAEVRSEINRAAGAIRRDLIEAGCYRTFTIAPPPAIGGLIMRNVDPLDVMFDPPYGHSVFQMIIDLIDNAVGVYSAPDFGADQREAEAALIEEAVHETTKGYVFIAMPMAGDRPEYVDVHDAIRHAADNCGLKAERVDDVQSNERITDRLIDSIRRAEFVVVDLTDLKPNVFWEAGYAHGLRKLPIYIARVGTVLPFDLKDFPVIFFENMRTLREGLERRFRALSASSA